MPPVVSALLTLITYAPSAIKEVNALYTAVRGNMSSTDQVTIDTALAKAQQEDADATAKASAALDAAAQR